MSHDSALQCCCLQVRVRKRGRADTDCAIGQLMQLHWQRQCTVPATLSIWGCNGQLQWPADTQL